MIGTHGTYGSYGVWPVIPAWLLWTAGGTAVAAGGYTAYELSRDPTVEEMIEARDAAALAGDAQAVKELNDRIVDAQANAIQFIPTDPTFAPGVEAGHMAPAPQGKAPVGVGNVGTAAPPYTGKGGKKPPKPGVVIGGTLGGVLLLGAIIWAISPKPQTRRRRRR